MDRKILIVEDEPHTRALTRNVLAGAGFDVLEAQNGIEAIARMRDDHPDLVILDLVLPVMDGERFLDFMRQDKGMASTPVIVFSTKGQPDIVERLMNLGISDYLMKIRTTPKALLEKVKYALERKEGSTARHYDLAVNGKLFDAASLARDCSLPFDYTCPECGSTLLLRLEEAEGKKDGSFSARFTCRCTQKSKVPA